MIQTTLNTQFLKKLPISSRLQIQLTSKLLSKETSLFRLALLNLQTKLQGTILGKIDPDLKPKRCLWWMNELQQLKLQKSSHPAAKVMNDYVNQNSFLIDSYNAWIDQWIYLLSSTNDSWINQAEFNRFINDFNNSADILFAEALLRSKIKHQLKEFIIAAGTAKTRISFLRDFGEHIRNAHVLLPLNMLGEFSLTTYQVSQWRNETHAVNWQEIAIGQTQIARELYVQANQWLTPLPMSEKKNIWPLLAELQLAMHTLNEIANNNFAVISQKIESSPGKAIWLTLKSRFLN